MSDADRLYRKLDELTLADVDAHLMSWEQPEAEAAE